ncbi:MAG: 3'-5' exoribonuclease [Pyramidobacter sp.]|nr:3'-5' exoribonuclease [Pyramidobacter sp.]MBQ8129418.1 3'-5' exoribonuclease [Clostridia bacterium]
MIDFIAVDFETANSDFASACAMGAVLVHDGEIADEYYSLIRPPEGYDDFSVFNTAIHGITEDDVKDAPEFPEVWGKVAGSVEGNTLVAHFAPFDCHVIEAESEVYGLPILDCAVACSCVISKRAWRDLLSFGLESVAEKIGFQFEHHNALEDARAAAQIILAAVRETGVSSWEELEEKLRFHRGVFKDEEYRSCRADKGNIHLETVDYTNPDLSPEDFPLWKKNFVFTGTLRSMSREEAMNKVVAAGGGAQNGVTKKTDYLVMGLQDYSLFTDGEKSNKTKKAEELRAKGSAIEIISEADFLNMLGETATPSKASERRQRAAVRRVVCKKPTEVQLSEKNPGGLLSVEFSVDLSR